LAYSIFREDHAEYIRCLDVESRIIVVGSLMNYLFRGCMQADLYPILEKHAADFDFLGWRRNLHRNGLLIKDAKVYVYCSFCNYTADDLKGHTDLNRADKRLLTDCLTYKPLRKRLNAIYREGHRPLLTKDLSEYVTSVITAPDLKAFLHHLTRNKLNFLSSIFRHEPHDLEIELISWAVYALYKSYPRYDDLGHGLAISKTAMHNRAMNMIAENTAVKSNRAINYNVSIYDYPNASTPTGVGNHTTIQNSLMADISGASMQHQTPSISAEDIVEAASTSLSKKEQKLVYILAGNSSRGFSAYLGEPNYQAAEKMNFSVYSQKACKFLGLPAEILPRVYSQLRESLNSSNNLQSA